jgi:archaellum biogenesis ATPase FlaH
MVDMPLGVYRLDSMLDGGVPTGSVLVLATEPGAGGRKFAHTSAAMNALATADNELYERYYLRDLDADTVVAPQTVNYVSLSATAESLEATLADTVADDAAASAAEAINYRDLSPTYFADSPVPEAWYRHDEDSPSALPADDGTAEGADDATPSALPADSEGGDGGGAGSAGGTDDAGGTGGAGDAASDTGVEQIAEFDGVRPPEYDVSDDTATDTAEQPSETDAGGDPFEYSDSDGDDAAGGDETAGGGGSAADDHEPAGGASAGGASAGGASAGEESESTDSDDDTDGYTRRTDGGRDPAADGDAQPMLPALRSYLTDNAPESLTIIDALTDLRSLPDEEAAWPEVTRLLRGLTRAVSSWGGVVLVVVDAEAVTDAELGALSAAATGTLEFAWETGGSQRARVLNIRELRGALDRLDPDEIVQFEAEMHPRGYDLTNVRKIR